MSVVGRPVQRRGPIFVQSINLGTGGLDEAPDHAQMSLLSGDVERGKSGRVQSVHAGPFLQEERHAGHVAEVAGRVQRTQAAFILNNNKKNNLIRSSMNEMLKALLSTLVSRVPGASRSSIVSRTPT